MLSKPSLRPLDYATDTAPAEARGHLLHNLILFGRLLRGLGLNVNTARVMDVAHALEFVNIGQRADFFYTLRGLMVHRKEDLPMFDHAFKLFWHKYIDEGDIVKFPRATIKKRSKPVIKAPPLKEQNDEGNSAPSPDQPPLIEVTMTYSDAETLRAKDFAEMNSEELAAVKELMATLVWQLGQRRTRRLRPGRDNPIDMRRTLRKNLRFGGEVLHWAHRTPKYKPRPLVILADISGSMERYTRLLLHFVYSLSQALKQPVESFVFGTRLTRISRQIDNKDVDLAIKEVGHTVNDWAGGTRIGDSLKTFNFRWGRRVLGHGAIALIISDGWDRGDVKLLADEMARLQRNCHRLIWLNPLLGMADYEPLTRGIQAALPYIDDFMPVHNLASLEELAAHLARLGQGRGPRRKKA